MKLHAMMLMGALTLYLPAAYAQTPPVAPTAPTVAGPHFGGGNVGAGRVEQMQREFDMRQAEEKRQFEANQAAHAQEFAQKQIEQKQRFEGRLAEMRKWRAEMHAEGGGQTWHPRQGGNGAAPSTPVVSPVVSTNVTQ